MYLFLHSWAPFDGSQPWGADPGGPKTLVAELRAVGRRVEHLAADFRTAEAPQQIVDVAVRVFGHVDILVANHTYSTLRALEELTAAEIDAHLEVNVRGTLLLVKTWAERHDDYEQGGRVVLMTSS